MHLGIDAVNIREGGGVTHLKHILATGDPPAAGIDRITLWTREATRRVLPQKPWLTLVNEPWMEAASPWPQLRIVRTMPRLVRAAGCEVLFAPGGSLPGECGIPAITMSRNLLPFEPAEAARFGLLSSMRLKMRLLRDSQRRSYQRADGVIFLTQYARDTVTGFLDAPPRRTALIPHGVETRFTGVPRTHRALDQCDRNAPFRLLYVSIIWSYKHQLEVAQAVASLRSQGLPVQVEFVGEARGHYGQRFISLIKQLDPQREFLLWNGEQPHDALHQAYAEADAFVFASSCENMPNILIEAMAAGLPIACADRGPMPEVLGDAGIYFDPDVPESIAQALRMLMADREARAQLAALAAERARAYSWEKCARDTFHFIRDVYDASRRRMR
jgi:glycosyltransferase involved in cell wall biosynthesis